MTLNEWRVKYLIRGVVPSGNDERDRDEAAHLAKLYADQDVPQATTTVLSVKKTPKGYFSVEVLRKRWA